MYIKYLNNNDYMLSMFGDIEIDTEVAKKLSKDFYKATTIATELITLENFNLHFEKINIEVQEIPNINIINSIAKQVGFLSIENKKKDVQIEGLMKSVSSLINTRGDK